MPTVSSSSPNILVALAWYAGGILLLLKGGSLLAEAAALRPGLVWAWVAVGTALLAGGLEAKFLLSRNCETNLTSIASLEQPEVRQLFRPEFLVALAAVILVGATLSGQDHNQYPLLIGVAALDLALAVDLLGKSFVFWRERALLA
jgi:hypothetical protein